MRGFELVEELSRRPHPSFFQVRQTLADPFLGIGLGGNVEQTIKDPHVAP
jgi:hypothetical protein